MVEPAEFLGQIPRHFVDTAAISALESEPAGLPDWPGCQRVLCSAAFFARRDRWAMPMLNAAAKNCMLAQRCGERHQFGGRNSVAIAPLSLLKRACTR